MVHLTETHIQPGPVSGHQVSLPLDVIDSSRLSASRKHSMMCSSVHPHFATSSAVGRTLGDGRSATASTFKWTPFQVVARAHISSGIAHHGGDIRFRRETVEQTLIGWRVHEPLEILTSFHWRDSHDSYYS